MLHTLKVVLELLLTLAAMRCLSWGIGWMLARTTSARPAWGAFAANVASLGIFAGVLAWNLMPGEPFDYAALTFGAVVYLACFLADVRWRPWVTPSPRTEPGAAEHPR